MEATIGDVALGKALGPLDSTVRNVNTIRRLTTKYPAA